MGINIYGQKQINCKKLTTITKDEFTGDIKAFTEPVKIYDSTWKHLLREIVDKNDISVDFEVHMSFYLINEIKTIAFGLVQHNHLAPAVDNVYAKFTDGTVIQFKEGVQTDRTENDAYSSSTFTFYNISEEDLNTFKEKTIEKFRITYSYNPREPYSDVTEKEKQSKLIQDTANCFVDNLIKK